VAVAQDQQVAVVLVDLELVLDMQTHQQLLTQLLLVLVLQVQLQRSKEAMEVQQYLH